MNPEGETSMHYKNAALILPDVLLRELQKYAAGEAIYVPMINERKKWGEGSGSRAYYRERNDSIRETHQSGKSHEQLAEQFGLSVESIRRIIYQV